jgi:hypothetical protein
MACFALFTGCITRNSERSFSRISVVIKHPNPEKYFIRVSQGSDWPVSEDGRVTFIYVTVLKHWQFGVADAHWGRDHDSTDFPPFYIMTGTRVVRKVYQTDLPSSILDPQGAYVIHLKDM